jgi:hypothetical protein
MREYHEPSRPVPGITLGDFGCTLCGERLGSYQGVDGSALFTWMAAEGPCPGGPAKRTTTDEKVMHQNCRDETLAWWTRRQALTQ